MMISVYGTASNFSKARASSEDEYKRKRCKIVILDSVRVSELAGYS